MTQTQFKPGQSGNPKGRPPGARGRYAAALDKLGEEAAEEIIRAIVAKAKEGDAVAAKLILERVWPLRKGARVEFELPPIVDGKELPTAITGVTEQVAAGKLSPDEGALIVGLLEAQRKAIETGEMLERIERLEAIKR